MINTFPYNCLNFSNDFNRESKYFNPQLQRGLNLIASPLSGYLSFEFIPSVMPESAPTAVLHINSSVQSNSRSHDSVVTLADRYIYFFTITGISVSDEIDAYVTINGYTDIIQAEKFECVAIASLPARKIISLVGYNPDDTYGYFGSTHPICGLFEYSELNSRMFGNEQTEYNYSYGRKKILSSENFIKTRITFVNLTMYRQNLLKWLCKCQTLTINGVAHYLVSDFVEKNKDENNEICDLQADFVPVAQSNAITGATEAPGAIKPTNLFM